MTIDDSSVEAKLSHKNEKVGKILSFRAINSIRTPSIVDTIIIFLASKSYGVNIIGRRKQNRNNERNKKKRKNQAHRGKGRPSHKRKSEKRREENDEEYCDFQAAILQKKTSNNGNMRRHRIVQFTSHFQHWNENRLVMCKTNVKSSAHTHTHKRTHRKCGLVSESTRKYN